MRIDRPPPGEELNRGDVSRPRLAASVILVRDAPSREWSGGAPEPGRPGIQVLLVQRNPNASFMGGAWVFPGGSVHHPDRGPEDAALRELREEAGLALADDALLPFSRWITPAEVKLRFDTWFFLAAAPEGAEPACDGEECVDLRWIAPAAALAEGRRGDLLLVFPTIKHLEELARLASVEHALAAARGRDVTPVLPRVVTGDGGARVVLPGEPGYDD